jgi:hypothetical protein
MIQHGCPSVTRVSVRPFPSARWLGCCAVPFPPLPAASRAPRSQRHSHVWQPPVSFAPSSFVRCLSPLGMLLTLPWPLGRTCRGASGLPWPSQGHLRAWPVLVVLGCRGSTPDPTPMVGIGWPSLSSSMLHMYVLSVSDVSYVCCNCFILMLQK